MGVQQRIERQLELALADTEHDACPPTIGRAMRYAVFPGGARIRPRLCLAVAAACLDERSDNTDRLARAAGSAAAVELMHCASLVHDDLPCFDDADIRRGKPSVHKAFGENIALLTGDALIVKAFETLASAFRSDPASLGKAVGILAGCSGVPSGIAAGQAWEVESDIPLELYHRTKTGAMFIAAVELGALATNARAEDWTAVGRLTGEAFQAIDDIRDVCSSPEEIGKPVGQDARLARRNLALEAGLPASTSHVMKTIDRALHAIPATPGRALLAERFGEQLRRFLPENVRSERAERGAASLTASVAKVPMPAT